LAVCATLGNANGWADIERFGKAKFDFFRTFLDLPNGIPSHDTFGRVFARLDPAALMACIQQWLDALGRVVAGEVVAIDGKTLRGSFDTAAAQNPLHLVSAWACAARLTLGQVAVDAQSNEITAIPLLLELVSRSADETLKVWEAATGQEILSLKDHTVETRLFRVAFSPDGTRIAATAGQHVRVLDGRPWTPDAAIE